MNSWSWAPETWRRPSNDQSANQTAAKRPVCHLVAGVWQRTTAYDQIWASKKKISSLKKLWTWLARWLHYIFSTLPSVWAVSILMQGVKKCKIIRLNKIMRCHIIIYLGAYNKVVLQNHMLQCCRHALKVLIITSVHYLWITRVHLCYLEGWYLTGAQLLIRWSKTCHAWYT